MARESYAQKQIPTGVDSIPHPTQRELANGQFKYASEVFYAVVLGAGGAGAELEGIPFEPVEVKTINKDAIGMNSSFVDGGAINLVTGAAGTAVPVAADGETYTASVPTALAPDGENVYVICTGARGL